MTDREVKYWHGRIDDAVAAEREACAKIAEKVADEAVMIETGGLYCGCGEEIAETIRARGK